jgi:hypothetical protein
MIVIEKRNMRDTATQYCLTSTKGEHATALALAGILLNFKPTINKTGTVHNPIAIITKATYADPSHCTVLTNILACDQLKHYIGNTRKEQQQHIGDRRGVRCVDPQLAFDKKTGVSLQHVGCARGNVHLP